MNVSRHSRPAILDSIPLHSHAVIEASAGTGKTYTLEHMVVELLLSAKVTLPEILVVTFTDRAAAELRVRIRAKIQELVEGRGLAQPEDTSVWEIDEEKLSLLRSALSSFDAASISTIHSFCQRVLRENAFAGAQLFEQSQVDGEDAFEQAFHETLRSELSTDSELVPWLDAWLAEHSVDSLKKLLHNCHSQRAEVFVPESVLALTSITLDCSADDLAAGLKEARQERKRKLQKLTLKMLRGLTELQGMDTLEFALSVSSLFSKEELDYLRKNLPSPNDSISVNWEKFWEVLSALELAPLFFKSQLVKRFLPLVQRRLNSRKLEKGLFDFDDLLIRVHEGLEQNEGLVNSLRSQFRYALVDEFQDTDEVQWNIFKKIFLEIPNGQGPKSALYVIGDPKQAIYRFRGADIHTYYRAINEIGGKSEEGKIVLDKNYRSTPAVIDAYNQIFDQEAEPPFFSKEGTYEHPVGCGNPVRVLLDRNGNKQSPVKIVQLLSQSEKTGIGVYREGYADYIAAEIRSILSEEGALFVQNAEDEPPQRIRARDIFILGRNKADGLRVGEALRKAGVPHAFYRQEGLFQTDEARDIRDLLLAIAKPDNVGRRVQAWMTPFFALSVEEAALARELSAPHPLLDPLMNWAELAGRREYSRLFADILSDSGVLQRSLVFDSSERSLTNYQHLFEQLLERDASNPADLSQLVMWLAKRIDDVEEGEEQDSNLQRLETDEDAVQIMTMHASKGLEASVVFLAGFSSQVRQLGNCTFLNNEGERLYLVDTISRSQGIPSSPTWELAQNLIEEESQDSQRLLYVAITRAKARLYLPFLKEDGNLKSAKVEADYLPLQARLERMFENNQPPVVEVFPAGGSTDTNTSGEEIDDPEATSTSPTQAQAGPEPEIIKAASESGSSQEPSRGLALVPTSEAGDRGAKRGSEAGLADPSQPRLFERVQVLTHKLDESELATATSDEKTLSELWETVAIDDLLDTGTGDQKEFLSLRRNRSGFVVSSYSSLKKAGLGGENVPRDVDRGDEKEDAEDEDFEPGDILPGSGPGRSTLKGGREVGNFLHEVLERVSLDSFAQGGDWKSWCQRPEISTLIESSARRNGVSLGSTDEVRDEAGRICHQAMTSSLELAPGLVLPPIAQASDLVRELEFLFPIPEVDHPSFAESIGDEGLSISKGFIKGFIDVVFTHQGKAWLADWKSDRLPSWNPRSLQDRVKNEYQIQAQLYTLALVKLLGIQNEEQYEERFGGLLYLFLRGMDAGKDSVGSSEGVYYDRPQFSEVLEWELFFKNRSFWGVPA